MKKLNIVEQLYRLRVALLGVFLIWIALCVPVYADVDDDLYEGNIFTLYGYNGSLVPPRVTLKESTRLGQPAFVIFYIYDSRDCKLLAAEISQLQARFGQAVNFIAVNIDAFPQDQPELQKYYDGSLPRLLLFNGRGDLTYEATGYIKAATVAPYFRKLLANEPPKRTPVPLQVDPPSSR